MEKLDLGAAAIAPAKPVTAGSYQTITFTYTAGHPVDDTGCIKIAWRFAGDFGVPQWAEPAAPDFTSVATTGDCRIEPRWDPKGNTRPWGRALLLKVMGGYLDRGDTVTVVFGDTRHGSPGWRMQTFREDTFEFKTYVDPIATYEFKELPQSPTLKIVPGAPTRAVCVAPSQVKAGERFAYHLKLEDAWGNPTAKPKKLTHRGFRAPGAYTVTATDAKTRLSAESNPIDVVEDAALRPCWADFHGQSEETIGSNTIVEYYTFARDRAFLDICAHQGNDFQVTDEFWARLNQAAKDFYKPGEFVTFPGYEWSGNTPLGGDRNIYFDSEGGKIVHSCADLLPGKTTKYPIAYDADTLYKKLAKQRKPRAFAFAHVGGRYAHMAMHHPEVEVAMEIHSAWGTFEWLVEDALQHGCRIGVCANSDGHKGRPGASYPGASKFGSLGGLTCVLAETLDRPAVAKALRARHCYATTGHRPLLDVRLLAGDGRSAMMGDVVEVKDGTATLCVRTVGTSPIESVLVRNGLEEVQRLRPYGQDDLGNRIKVVWGGAEVKGRARIVDWTGSLSVKGNRIVKYQPINFHNAAQPMVESDRNTLEWRTITSGGVSGVILTLEKPNHGTLEVCTLQKIMRSDVKNVGLKPRLARCGGVEKRIEIYRLPPEGGSREFHFELPLPKLRKGDNPIYVRVNQEDGHMAWSSPVYAVRK